MFLLQVKKNYYMNKITDIDSALKKIKSSPWFREYHEPEVWEFFENNLENVNLAIVEKKVHLLNQRYKTRLGPLDKVASEISKIKDLDKDLKKGGTDVVNKIVDAVYTYAKKEHYSFATKFSAMHNPKEYPIFDNIVESRFIAMLKLDMLAPDYKCYHTINKAKALLKNYTDFKRLYDCFMKIYGVADKYKYREIDLYIWAGGKGVETQLEICINKLKKTNNP